MKDKRLDALLETLPTMECAYYDPVDRGILLCYMGIDRTSPDADMNAPFTNCGGDIRKCEREE